MLLITTILLAGCGAHTSDLNDTPPQPEPVNTPPPPESVPEQNSNTPTPDEEQPQNGEDVPEGFFITINDVEIHMGVPVLPIIEKLGEPLNYFEAPSCAFEGVDKSWFYNSFEIHAYPVDEEDFILSVLLIDDVYGTDKYIYIGMSYDDMVAAYGSDYEHNQEQYMYRLGGTSLSFIVSYDYIMSITYRYEDAPQE